MSAPIPCSMADVLTLTRADPLVRGARGGAAWRNAGGEAIAFTGYDAEDRIRSLVALGPREQIPDLVLALRDEVPEGIRVVVPRGTPLPLARPVDWHFRATYDAPPPQPAEDAVGWYGDERAITELLTAVNPDTSAWPGNPKVRRWAGVRADDAAQNGGLLACLADTSAVGGVGHVSAIAVAAEARGRGLGPSITAWAVRRLRREGCDVVTLGVYAGNTAALRMYDRLGFAFGHALTSGVLPKTS